MNLSEEKKDTIFSIIFLTIIFSLMSFGVYKGAIENNIELKTELDYKNKIIERSFGKNFDSYEDYMLWRIEKGE